MAEPESPVLLSGKILETGKLLLFTQQGCDLRKKCGKAENPDPSEKTVGGIFKTVLQAVMILNVTKTKLPFF